MNGLMRHRVTEQSLNRGIHSGYIIKSPHVAIVFELEVVFKCFFAQTRDLLNPL